MVRRWSYLKNSNLFFTYNLFLIKRFNTFKLLKAVNYKKFTTNVTKFGRHKLAKWRRHSTWLSYIEIFKFWVRDYNFFKKLAKSQFSESFFLNSFFIHDLMYIKKKNPLNAVVTSPHYVHAISKIFLKYFNKKYLNKNSILFLSYIQSTNFVSINSLESNPLLSQNNIFYLLNKSQNEFFAINLLSKKQTFTEFFLHNLNLQQILYTYKIFFFFFLILFN
jgi:hypothetical protein